MISTFKFEKNGKKKLLSREIVVQIMNIRTTYFLKSIYSLITISLDFIYFRICSIAFSKK